MDDVHFAVLGTGGIGRRTLEVSQHRDGLVPVAACDRNGIAVDHGGLDVDELLAATEGNIASGPDDDEAVTDGGATADAGGVKQHGEDAGVVASAQADPTETPIDDVVAEGDALDAVLIALPNFEHGFIPSVADRFAAADTGACSSTS